MKQTVYTASPESQQIHVWDLDLEGKLTLVQVVDAPGQVQPMVVSPNKEFLYVGVRPEFRVLAYRIAPDNGALTFAGEAALPGSPTHISTDHQGRYLFSASYNSGSVSVVSLANDGLPGEVVDVIGANQEVLDGAEFVNCVPAVKRSERYWRDTGCFDFSQEGFKIFKSCRDRPTVRFEDSLVKENTDHFSGGADAI